MNKKIIALILTCLCVAMSVMTGCANGSGKGGEAGGGGIGHPNLPEEKDWGGEEFIVLTTQDRSATQAFNIVDLVAYEDDDMSNPITKAVFERNERIKSVYNAKIVRSEEGNDSYNNIINNSLAYGSEYSAYVMKVQGALSRALAGDLLNLNDSNDVGYIDLRGAWWDNAIIDSLAVKNKAFFALGDINTVDDDGTWCVLFNKYLQDKYDLPSFYDTVKAGEWTLEKMKMWASTSIVDLNDNGVKHDPNNSYQYGLYYQSDCAHVLLSAAGMTPFLKEGNVFKSNLNNLQNAIDTIRDNMMMDDAVHQAWALNIDNVNAITSNDKWDEIARGGFKANKALFFMCHCGSINLLRDMDEDFGILPIPKIDSTQEEYGNTIQYGTANCYVIPTITRDSDFSGFMLEAMGYLSSREAFEDKGGEGSLRYAYYDTTLQRKGARDDESWDMLDLVFDNRIFDISLALGAAAGSVDNLIEQAATGKQVWATLLAGNGEKIQSLLNESIAELLR